MRPRQKRAKGSVEKERSDGSVHPQRTPGRLETAVAIATVLSALASFIGLMLTKNAISSSEHVALDSQRRSAYALVVAMGRSRLDDCRTHPGKVTIDDDRLKADVESAVAGVQFLTQSDKDSDPFTHAERYSSSIDLYCSSNAQKGANPDDVKQHAQAAEDALAAFNASAKKSLRH